MTACLKTIQFLYKSANLNYEQAFKGAEFILRHYRPLQGLGPEFSAQQKGLLTTVEAMIDVVAAYPDGGTLYADLLKEAYIKGQVPTEGDLLEALHLTRSTYYRRKKEAIALFALALYNRL